MIGRALDLGIECASYIFGNGRSNRFVGSLRAVALPIEKRSYRFQRNEDGTIAREYTAKCSAPNMGWGDFESDGQLKRDCARAFEQRRKAKIGDYFEIPSWHYGCLGTAKFRIPVHRKERNAVIFRGHIISSSRKTLLKYRDLRLEPVLYRGVIW
jgi:hypothetical protein